MINTICCIYSNCLLTLNSYSIRNMCRIEYWNELRKKSLSCWSLLCTYITMHCPQNVKREGNRRLCQTTFLCAAIGRKPALAPPAMSRFRRTFCLYYSLKLLCVHFLQPCKYSKSVAPKRRGHSPLSHGV